MKFLRIGSCLLALFFSFSSLAAGAELTYSGVPGKWRRASKADKNKAPDSAAAKQADEQEKGKKTKTIPVHGATVTFPNVTAQPKK
jgi:hypothetical protein